jgi:predicted nucleotide-binding protein (sugar kinase/HSP70/actin superfamily)
MGDLIQKITFRNRAYEIHKGDTKKKYDKWMEICKDVIANGTYKDFKRTIAEMVEDFETIEVDLNQVKPRVGIVGEVLIKYHPYGNNHIVEKLEEEGAEVINPDFMGFIKFICTHKITNNMLLNRDKKLSAVFKIAIKLIGILERPVNKALAASKKGYMPTPDIWELETKVKDILSIGNQTGEGWFLTAEMCEYIEHGIPNIVCVQPFACLPNHVVGKGVIKTIRAKYPEANISPIDYDPGASETNQFNRIKLMMAQAKDNLKNN